MHLRSAYSFRRVVLPVATVLWCVARPLAAEPSPLAARGYTVLPVPQAVTLRDRDLAFSDAWRVALGRNVRPADMAVESLREGLRSRFRVTLSSAGASPATGATIVLDTRPGAVTVGPVTDRNTAALAKQAYRMDLAADRVTITANGPAGLFYGVQTFLQLLERRDGRLCLPEGEIVDWPDLELRVIFWDDAHHLERLDVLKAALRQAAFFKINGFAIKLEGHFQYRSAPAIVEPHALRPADLQELTAYAGRRHIQLIPYLDAPAHDAFILKHPEYAALREFPECNYECCVVKPETYRLFFGLFQDLLDANRGGKYFVLSTDEPYYVGLADHAPCDEAARARALGGVGKLLAEFVTRTANYLHDRGRTVLFWGEYPLKPEDIPALPSHLVNGETYGPKFDPRFRAQGIRQLIYTSTQGEEPLFPNYYPLPMSQWLHRRPEPDDLGRVAEMWRKISFDPARQQADLMGAFVAGWADAGLHPETFWLGYATGPAVAWHPGVAGPEELMGSFYTLFYGPATVEMARVYQLLSQQARFWADSWETTSSRARTPIFGNSYGVFHPPRPARDQTLPALPIPSLPNLQCQRDWTADNSRRLELTDEFLARNDELLGLLEENLRRARFNRYNLQVLRSVARLCRQNLELLQGLGRIDQALKTAAADGPAAPAQAVAGLDHALDLAEGLRRERNGLLADTVATWYQSWFPRVAQANGRRYLDQVDDVKDHLPVRTVDMRYLVYRELLYPLGAWADQVRDVRNQFAQTHHLPPRQDKLDWANTRR
ncbi:MAG: family 20 glycosylhydrolase [Verrucomicrobia bacterium]|nr:family 20 glycosylhydrolase [Verrucomicrobiota bacterium]